MAKFCIKIGGHLGHHYTRNSAAFVAQEVYHALIYTLYTIASEKAISNVCCMYARDMLLTSALFTTINNSFLTQMSLALECSSLIPSHSSAQLGQGEDLILADPGPHNQGVAYLISQEEEYTAPHPRNRISFLKCSTRTESISPPCYL